MQSVRRVAYIDQDFTSKQIKSRREDAAALAEGKVSAGDLQALNSILAKNFGEKSQIDWKSLATGTKSSS